MRLTRKSKCLPPSSFLEWIFAFAALSFTVVRAGFCNWGPDGTGASSVCQGGAQGGSWCNANQDQCENGCGGRWCTADGSPPPPTPSPPTPAGVGYATTTRYWDCSGGACGCAYLPTHLDGDQSKPAHCHSNAMFAAPPGNPYGAAFYGSAAISSYLGGGNWLAEGCGKCWKVTGTSNIPGYDGVTTTLVLRGTNYCPPGNPLCDAGPHFDIAAPGFDVLKYSFAHTCPEREKDEADGFAACGNWLINDNNPDINCDCSLFNSDILRSGCENFYSLKWDNPTVSYEEVTCPPEMVTPCWEDNDNGYPAFGTIPETCLNPAPASTPTPPPVTSSPPPTPPPTPPPVTPSPTVPPTPPPTPPPVTITPAPTLPPTPPPTTLPLTPPPTNPPFSPPTPPPTSPLITPVPTPPPTPPPTRAPAGTGAHCCTYNYKNCKPNDPWCNANEAQCTGSCSGHWMDVTANAAGLCLALDTECTDEIDLQENDPCCPPATCQGNQWYRQCLDAVA